MIDDISYVRRSELETSVLFELICHRYERRSLLVTSNQPFREWDEIFPAAP
ncbi:istB-like ATP binding family protein [Cyanobium sp. NS01]|nr:istB-like ATP binding family protein [Cyanobium sp. NS01]